MAVKDQNTNKPLGTDPPVDWPGRYLALSEQYGRETLKLRKVVTVLGSALPAAAVTAYLLGRRGRDDEK